MYVQQMELVGHDVIISRNPKDELYYCGIFVYSFLQRVSIACYAERCISYDRFCLTYV